MSSLEKVAIGVLVVLVGLIAFAQFAGGDDTSGPSLSTQGEGQVVDAGTGGEVVNPNVDGLEGARRNGGRLGEDDDEPVSNSPKRPGVGGGTEGDDEILPGGTPSPVVGGEQDRIEPKPGPQPNPGPTPPAPVVKGREHVVVQGDKLWNLAAAEYGRGHADAMLPVIAEANPGLRAETLRIGQRIVLPPMPESFRKKDGKADVSASGPARPAASPRDRHVKSDIDTLGFIQEGRFYSGDKAEGNFHVVAEGETLGEISQKRLGSVRYVQDIVRLNGLKDENKLQVGQRLKLPTPKR